MCKLCLDLHMDLYFCVVILLTLLHTLLYNGLVQHLTRSAMLHFNVNVPGLLLKQTEHQCCIYVFIKLSVSRRLEFTKKKKKKNWSFNKSSLRSTDLNQCFSHGCDFAPSSTLKTCDNI